MKPIKGFSGPAAALPLHNLDTDQIIPARFMSRSRAEGYGDQCFHDLRFDADGSLLKDFPLNALAIPPKILVTGDNFGCGSSREAAVYALLDYGIGAVVSTGFADIFRSNAGNNGLLTLVLPELEVLELLAELELAPGAEAAVDLPQQTLTIADGSFEFEIDARLKHRLLNGLDDLSATLQDEDRIESFEKVHFADSPWLRPTTP